MVHLLFNLNSICPTNLQFSPLCSKLCSRTPSLKNLSELLYCTVFTVLYYALNEGWQRSIYYCVKNSTWLHAVVPTFLYARISKCNRNMLLTWKQVFLRVFMQLLCKIHKIHILQDLNFRDKKTDQGQNCGLVKLGKLSVTKL